MKKPEIIRFVTDTAEKTLVEYGDIPQFQLEQIAGHNVGIYSKAEIQMARELLVYREAAG